MSNPTDSQLKSMARLLRDQIGVANELNLGFTAQLLAMAVLEITTKLHGISQQELHALCERIDRRPSIDRKPAMAVVGLRSFDRRTRVRRSRM
jgi:ABC-type Na+ transport system ATPase subunit NatA